MKVRFKYNIRAMTGKIDDLVYYYHPKLDAILSHRYTQPRRNPSADWMRMVMANLKLIQPSEGYKQNFRDYLIQYNNLSANRDRPALNWMNLYLKMMFTLVKSQPGIDLTTLSRAQIYAQNLPCTSVRSAIEAGLMPRVRDFERFVNQI